MNISNLSSTDLRQALRLMQQRNELLQQAAQVEQQIATIEGGQPAPAAATVSKPASGSARKPAPAARVTVGGRRKLKDEVVALLQAAGPAGLTVSELASRLGVDVNRVFTWFYATGKKISQIKKLANARYRWAA